MAVNVSNDFRPTVYSGGALYKCYLYINNQRILPSQISSITIYRPIIDTEQKTFYIGTFISDKIEVVFRNIDELNINTGDEAELNISLMVNGQEELVNCGTFIIDDLGEDYYKKNKITALDDGIKFAEPVDTPIEDVFDYDSETDTYSISLEDLLTWLCQHYGVTLGSYPNTNKNVRVGNWDSTISGKRYVSWIAEMMAGNAKIGRGKNLGYTGWANNFVSRVDNSNLATLTTYDNRNCLAFMPSAGANDHDNKYMFKINFKENTQYTFKFDKYSTGTWGDIDITYTDGTKQELRGMSANAWNNVKFTSQANKTIKYLSTHWRSNVLQYIDLDTFMVYEGTETLPYEPYINRTLNIRPLKSNPVTTINAKKGKSLVIGEKYKITGVTYFDAVRNYTRQSGTDEGNVLIIRQDNLFVTSQDDIDNIYDAVKDLEIYSMTTENYGDISLDAFDIVTYQVGEDSYNTFYNSTLTYKTSIMAKVDTQIPTKQQEVTTNVVKPTEASSIRKVQTDINSINGTITLLSEKVDENTENISSLQIEDTNIRASVQSLNESVTQIQTSTYTKTEIQQIVSGTGVDGVVVSAVVSTEATFDKDGMHYRKTNAPTESLINQSGLGVYATTNNNELLYAGYDDDTTSPTYGSSIVRTQNLTVSTYLNCGGNGRFESYEDSAGHIGPGFFLT